MSSSFPSIPRVHVRPEKLVTYWYRAGNVFVMLARDGFGASSGANEETGCWPPTLNPPLRRAAYRATKARFLNGRTAGVMSSRKAGNPFILQPVLPNRRNARYVCCGRVYRASPKQDRNVP